MQSPASKVLRASINSSRAFKHSHLNVNQHLLHSKRLFQSQRICLNKDDPAKATEAPRNHLRESVPAHVEQVNKAQEAEKFPESIEGSPSPVKPKDLSGYGSATRRAGRNIKRTKEISPLNLPHWFLERNVITREKICDGVDAEFLSLLSIAASPADKADEATNLNDAPNRNGGLSLFMGFQSMRRSTESYLMDSCNISEISASVHTGLEAAGGQNAESWASSKADLVLYHPKDGGSLFLSSFVRHLAAAYKSDLVTLGPQDIAEIGGDYLDEAKDIYTKSLGSLGYDAYLTSLLQRHSKDSEGNELAAEAEYEEIDEEEEEEDDDDRHKRSAFRSSKLDILPVVQVSGSLLDVLTSTNFVASKSYSNGIASGQAVDSNGDSKIYQFIQSILNAGQIKRATTAGLTSPNLTDEEPESLFLKKDDIRETPKIEEKLDSPKAFDVPPFSSQDLADNNLIILVHDYLEINATSRGAKMLKKLHEVVAAKRKDGLRMLVIGISSSKEFLPSFSTKSLKKAESGPENGPTRTIITPCWTRPRLLQEDHRTRISLINFRNLQHMIRRLSSARIIEPGIEERFADVLQLADKPKVRWPIFSKASESIWPLNFVHRLATTALFVPPREGPLTLEHLCKAFGVLSSSEFSKFLWLDTEREPEKNSTSSKQPLESSLRQTPDGIFVENNGDRMKRLRKICNVYEKKLLNGVIDSEHIRTTFADVRAPPETIKTLKNLTSLSLLRPDAFTYGVLATDKIPGLLLYGPPGTGKTVLAKAVAKESGATVLEVSGSDIYDKYVGEGEKNVKAVFSLAKKLTPCVIFIDEADAILGSRSGSSNRTSHRELINQFLREWDGMNDVSAFIMVATNRPFDLDEASLRRLPRRLLVDLPTKSDREAILRIHLRDEILDPSIDLADLASQTPFYSGSDLKNVAVAAALACVREEVDNAATLPSNAARPFESGTTAEGGSNITSYAGETHGYPSLLSAIGSIIPPPFQKENSVVAGSPPIKRLSHDSFLLSAEINQGFFPRSENHDNSGHRSETDNINASSLKFTKLNHLPKRILHPRHFKHALDEISASISEDMSSLAAIRKFDEKYGDRRGKNKRVGGYGFTAKAIESEVAKADEGARIRNLN